MTGRKLRVLLIHRFFKPDSAPYASILDDIRNLILEQNMQAEVLSSQPSYKTVDTKNKLSWKEKDESGSTIFRLPVFKFKNRKVSKLLNFLWFPFLAFWFVLFGRSYDVVTVSTAPPVVLAFLIALACKLRGSMLVYHCMDIHPEIGRISGEFKSNIVFKTLLWMDSYTCRLASKIIVLSDDMKVSLESRNTGILGSKIEIINNYDLNSRDVANQDFFDAKDHIKRVVFAGNIGRFQNLDSFILALKNNPPLDDFELLFVGEGVALEGLTKLSQGIEENIRFIPHQPVAIARQIIADADIAIVSLQEDVIKYAYPSKTMTCLAVGTPLLAMVEDDSELARFVSSNGLGFVVEPGDTSTIYNFFKKLSIEQSDFESGYIVSVFDSNFSKRQFNNKFLSLINGLV